MYNKYRKKEMRYLKMFALEMVFAIIGILMTFVFLAAFGFALWINRPLISKKRKKALAKKYGAKTF